MPSGASIYRRALAGALFAVLGTESTAQDVQFAVSDAGVATHTSHGIGIEIQVLPSRAIPGAAITETMLAQLCNHFAPSLIPFVLNEAEITDPDFVAIRVFPGGGGLRRDDVYQAFAVAGTGCGAPR